MHQPHKHTVPKYGDRVQYYDEDTTPPLPKDEATRVREIIGVLLYYGLAIDNTILVALGSIAAQLSKSTEATADAITDLLNYVATHPDAVVRFHASGMLLYIHADGSYLSEPKAKSRAAGFYFLSNKVDKGQMPPINGPIHVQTGILHNVMSSAAEVEVAAAFVAGKEGCPIRVTLTEMGWPQPPTQIVTDNIIAKGIVEDTVKQKRSKAMDMRFYWLRNRAKEGEYEMVWLPSEKNLSDYHTKHFNGKHHQKVRPIYLYLPNSDQVRAEFIHSEPQANQLVLWGRVDTHDNGQYTLSLIPRVF